MLRQPDTGAKSFLRRRGALHAWHTLPLLGAAADHLAALGTKGEFALSTTDGARPISVTTLANWGHGAVGQSIPGFQLKRVRSGVETLLAANDVSREIRGQLQSHGLTGVQARHYDGYDYMPEKLQALEQLFAVLINRPKANAAQSRKPVLADRGRAGAPSESRST